MSVCTVHTPPKLSEAKVMKRCGEAFEAARRYFMVPSEWDVTLRDDAPDEGNVAQIVIDNPYLTADVSIDVRFLQHHPEEIWRVMGHECTHLVQAEYDLAQAAASENGGEMVATLFTVACERTSTRLERMFVRDVKDPHHKGGEARV